MAKKVVYDFVINDQGTATLKKISTTSEEAHGHVHALHEGIGELKNAFIELAGATAGIELIKSSLDAYKEERSELVKLGQVYKDNASNTKLSLDQLTEIAEKQENLTGIHKDQTEQVEVNLLKHKGLKIAYQDLIPVIEDYAKTSGVDAASASDVFGRALANPSRAMRVLMAAGVDLTENERQRLQSLAKMNDTTKAQTMLYDLLKDKYKGVAEAMFNANPEEQLALGFHQVQVELGHFVDELLVDLMPAIKGVIGDFKILVGWMEKHKQGLETAGKIIGGLVAVYLLYEATVKAAAAADFLFGTSLAELTVAEGAAAAGAGEAAEGMTALDVAMDANPIGLVIAAVAALVLGLKALKDGFDETNAAAAKGIVNTGKWIYENSNVVKRDKLALQNLDDIQKDYNLIQAHNKMLSGTATKKDIELFSNQQLTGADLEQDYKEKKLLAAAYQEIDKKNTSPKASIGSGKDTGDLKSPDPNDLKGEKHTTITFNIKQFGAENIVVEGAEEAGRKAGDNIFKHLLAAVNDAQTTADVN